METQDDSLDLDYVKQIVLGAVEVCVKSEPICGCGSLPLIDTLIFAMISQEPNQLLPTNVSTVPNTLTSHRQWQAERSGSHDDAADKATGDRVPIAVETVCKHLDVDTALIPHLSPLLQQHANLNPSKDPNHQLDNQNTVPESQVKRMSQQSCSPGDTQPISQSIYDSLIQQGKLHENGFGGIGDVEGREITQKTLYEGDTGHLDLLADFVQSQTSNHNDPEDNELPDDENSDLDKVSSPTRYAPFPESQRFLDRTPAGQKNGNALDDASTPSVPRNPFSTAGEQSTDTVMGLTQVFNATQAPSSPYVHHPRQEFSSDMPSPNIPIQRRLSSTIGFSPLQTTSPAFRSAGTEPQVNYISMKESQKVREKLAEEEKLRSARNSDDASDDGFEQEDSFIQRRIRRRETDEQVQRQFAGVTAPPRPESRFCVRRGAGPASSPTAELRNSRVQAPMTVPEPEVGHTVTLEETAGDTEVETEQEDEEVLGQSYRPQQSQAEAEDDKENIENGPIMIPDNTVLAHDALSQVLDTDANAPSHQTMQKQQSGAIVCSQIINVLNSQPPVGNASGLESVPNSERGTTEPKSMPLRALVGDEADEECIPSSPPRPADHTAATEDDFTGLDTIQQTVAPTEPETIAPATSSANDAPNENTGHIIKNSSMPSRVFETPAHNKLLGANYQSTVPETSPTAQRTSFRNFMNGTPVSRDDTASPTRDDENLPDVPHFSRSGIADNLQGSGSSARRLFRPPVSDVLSSPSGRTRRSMTEIASDESPYHPAADFLPDFGLMTAEDKKFESAVKSPVHRQKRRRANDGRALYMSSPLKGGVTADELAHLHQEELDIVEDSTDAPEEQRELFSEPMFNDIPRIRQRISTRPASVWEVEASPIRTINTEKPRTFRMPQKAPIPPPRLTVRERPHIVEAVVIHNPSSSSPQLSLSSAKLSNSSRVGRPPRPKPLPPKPERALVWPNESFLPSSQVFAFFNGRPQGYYVATCVGVSQRVGPLRYLVRFEDSTAPDEVDAGGIKRLELRVNDVVKVDLLDVPSVPYVVLGFEKGDTTDGDCPKGPDGLPVLCDIFGNVTVILKPKQADSSNTDQTIKVPIVNVYFNKILWRRLEDRQYTHVLPPSVATSRLQTPVDTRVSPSLPPSRAVRSFSTLTGIFSGMAFAVSYKDNESTKAQIEEMIIRNGGRIVKEGFDELFEQPQPATTRSSVELMALADSDAGDDGLLRLTPSSEQLGFVCLITDEHSRRVKYMQALALNIPCLAGRWIKDCISKNRILAWEPYLLPAGESKFLDGAVRSRIIARNPPATARLSETIYKRPKLLAGQSVLLVMDRGKIAEQRKAYAFLTYALGASRVGRAQDLRAAIELLVQDTEDPTPDNLDEAEVEEQENDHQSVPSDWDCIYVGDHKAAAVAKRLLSDAAASGVVEALQPPKRPRGRPQKQKRRREYELSVPDDVGLDGREVEVNGRMVRILDNDFVCQSLILGSLYED
ncbi:hypothetical protein AJ80_07681 [Polytolypa hystricis UAMH7299]|uniref:BRCT domain-containing protein n=1 Tax=Polytolypa hystricis (strain UAMH7299) TaxID=1447883 RepID=A0A2B7XJS0_POLH7|nr:hypothetical protein AJ80_07681 [Polytolypa hystricis UAMH7299]